MDMRDQNTAEGPARPTISALLTVRDEAEMIEGALRLLGFCDEIVVLVDDRSTDGTEAIARRYTDHVHVAGFPGFGGQWNEAARRASGDWVLFCDADERVTPRLATEMRARLNAGTSYDAFTMPLVNFFWGRRMRHGAWQEQHIRLIRRECVQFEGEVHPSLLIPPDRVGVLQGEFWHFSHRSIEENLRKAIHYGRLDAERRRADGAPRVTPLTLLRVTTREFLWRGVRHSGWLDGIPGVVEMLFQPCARMCAEVMLWERQQDGQIAERYAELERAVIEET